MEHIRKAVKKDACRIAEIIVFNYRLNFYPIFKNDAFYFEEMQVLSLAKDYSAAHALADTYVYDDGVVKGVLQMSGSEIKKLFVEPVLHDLGIGAELLRYAAEHCGATHLWALEKNERAIRFYQRNGFHLTGERTPEEDTTEYLVKLER